jgi:hypothetical protein
MIEGLKFDVTTDSLPFSSISTDTARIMTCIIASGRLIAAIR